MVERILVTGGAGFLGRHIVSKLKEEGYAVTPIDITLEPPFRADITDPHVLADLTDFDYIVHLAALAIPDYCRQHPQEAFDVNVMGTHNVLKLAQEADMKKVVFVSSAHVYGISPKFMPTPETHPLALHDIYTTTKILGEQLCRLFYDNYGLPFTTLRLFNAYGPGQPTDYFIPAMVRKARYEKIIHLKGAETTKDFVFVEDVADAFLKALRTSYVGEINIGSGQQTRLGYAASYIASRLNATYEPADEQPPETYMQASIRRAWRVLDWTPETPLKEGLDKTIPEVGS